MWLPVNLWPAVALFCTSLTVTAAAALFLLRCKLKRELYRQRKALVILQFSTFFLIASMFVYLASDNDFELAGDILFVAIIAASISLVVLRARKIGNFWRTSRKSGQLNVSADQTNIEIGIVDNLILELQNADAPSRLAAAHELGRLKEKRAVPYLVQSLTDQDHFVRNECARALAEIGDIRAVKLLVDIRQDLDNPIRGANIIIDVLRRMSTRLSLAEEILKSTEFDSSEKLDILNSLESLSEDNILFVMYSTLNYCRDIVVQDCGEADVRQGASEVMEEMERRAKMKSLLRPAYPLSESETLLRAAKNENGIPAAQLLRVAEVIDETKN